MSLTELNSKVRDWVRVVRRERPTLRKAARWALRPPKPGSSNWRKIRPLLSNDKILFGNYLRERGLPTGNDCLVVDRSGNVACANDATVRKGLGDLADGRYFAKPPYGDRGRGIFAFDKSGNTYQFGEKALSEDKAVEELAASAAGELSKRLLIQEAIKQHPAIAAIGPFSVNTLRLLTIKRRGRPARLLHSVMKVGRRGSIVDNAAAGGIVLLVREGVTHGLGVDKKATKHRTHPDTGAPLSGFAIPLWEEAVRACLEAHDHLPTYPSVGWDVAIAEHGPMIIENNLGWDETLHSSVDHRFRGLLMREGLKFVPEVALGRLRGWLDL